MTNTKEHNALVNAASYDMARGISIRSAHSSFQRLITIRSGLTTGSCHNALNKYNINKTLGGMIPND